MHIQAFCIYNVWCKENQKKCCWSWLQYRICYCLSTIQYVLVPQVQRELQSTLPPQAGSRPQPRSQAGSRSRSRSRPLLALGRGRRSREEEGSKEDQLWNCQRQDSREAHTCQGKRGWRWDWVAQSIGQSVFHTENVFVFVCEQGDSSCLWSLCL